MRPNKLYLGYKNLFLNIKLIITFIVFLSLTTNIVAQDSIVISGNLLNNTTFPKIVIKQFGTGVFDIAAIPVDKETGAFSITAPMDIKPGVYRFQYSQSGGDYLDIILNGKEKEINFTIDVAAEAPKRLPHFTKSNENIALYNFEQQRKNLYQEIDVLDSFINSYTNKKDAFYFKALKNRAKKVKNYQQLIAFFISATPYYFAKQIAAFTPTYFPNPTEDYRIQNYYKREKFWENKTTTDANLLNTPLYSDAVLEYLKYYMNPAMSFSEEEVNNGFKKSVDTIINRFTGNKQTQEFSIKYLQLGFKELGNEELLKYIDEKYGATTECTTGDDELQKRLKGYESLKEGNFAPEIVLTDINGSTRTLKDYPQEEVIVVFWASWCPHCMEEMPKLEEWAKKNPKTLVLAISLDDNFTSFKETIKNFPNMLHNCDLQKWNGKIVSDFYVAATPTFFKLDKERKIVMKYSSVAKLLE